MIGLVVKIIPKLTRDRVRKLINKELVEFIVQCLTLVAETPEDELIVRSSVMCAMVVVSLAIEAVCKAMLIDGGILTVLPRLLDCPIQDRHRSVGTFCAIATVSRHSTKVAPREMRDRRPVVRFVLVTNVR